MPTIPHTWSDQHLGDFPDRCDYCGVIWPRSKLRKDGSGLLVCPDEGDGLDQVTLSKLNAAMAVRRPPMGRDGREDLAKAVFAGDVADIVGLDALYSWHRADDAEVDASGLVKHIRSRAYKPLGMYQFTEALRPTLTQWGTRQALVGSAAGAVMAGRVPQDWTFLHAISDSTIGILLEARDTETTVLSTGLMTLKVGKTSGRITENIRFLGIPFPTSATWSMKPTTRQAIWVVGTLASGLVSYSVRLNGEEVATLTNLSPPLTKADSALTVTIYDDMKVAEVVTSQTVLSDAQLDAIDAYWERYE